MFGGNTDIGIDLGTANILFYVKGKGIVVVRPLKEGVIANYTST
jgi:rod shape-determining protein MreB